MASFDDILNEALLNKGMKAEKVPKGEKYILLLDIDDTLVTAQNIFIYRKLPSDKKEVKFTPEQYADENVTDVNKEYYDYRDFRNSKKIAGSILTGKPIWRNLRVMDHHIAMGWEIGILTARAMGLVIFKALRKWLKYRPVPGKGKIDTGIVSYLKGYKKVGNMLKRQHVHAVADYRDRYPGTTDFQRKAIVIKKYAKKYDKVKFLDDDQKNIDAVNNLKLDNVIAVKALKETM